MKKLFRIVQFGANLGIIVLGLLFTFIVLDQYVISPRTTSGQNGIPSAINPSAPKASENSLANTVMPLPEVDWAQNKTTVVLYLSTTCHFCNESSPFYQRLVQAKAKGDFKVVGVLPQTTVEATKYLESHDLKFDQIVSSSLGSIGVTSTPTLMLVSNGGVVFAFWRGKLDEKKEAEVLAKLSS